MAPNLRINKACSAMKALGVQEAKVRSILKELLKTYDNNWDFIEDLEYQVLTEAIFALDEAAQVSEPKAESKLFVEVEDDDNNEEEAPLKSRLRRKRVRGGCDNNTAPSSSKPTSKKPNKPDPKLKQEQHFVKEEEEDEIDEYEIPLKRLRRKPERGCESSASLALYFPKPDEDDHKTQPEEDKDDEINELPPVKRYLRQKGERRSDHIVSENDSLALPLVNSEPLTEHKPVFPENSSSLVVHEMDKPNMDMEEHDGEADITLTETTPIDLPSSESASESGAATVDISMELSVVLECDILVDDCGGSINVNDLTIGEEKIEIPGVNEVNDEVPPRFSYITQSLVFRDAAVKFSLDNYPDDQSCFSSSSSSTCSCVTAYTEDGLLKEDYLEARVSEARDQRKQVLRFCVECPLEKVKEEEVLEPCKGHIVRKAIKECWVKCGCSKRCGNKTVQRGIHKKLEVFYTPNGKGWGLRTLEKLPQGSFVCEYIGEILTIQELYQRSSREEVTCPVVLDAFWGSEGSLEENKASCLDGTRFGNISRFLNHRCLDANLIEIPVHVETPKGHYYHLAFFTTIDIEAMEELTWDYGIDFDDDDSPMKPFDCFCGSRFCRNKKRTKKDKKVIKRE